MYQILDDRPAISVNDWCWEGLTLDMQQANQEKGMYIEEKYKLINISVKIESILN